MILPDDTPPESPTKSDSRAGPPSEAPEDEHALPPPAYPGPPQNGQISSYQSHSVDIEAQASSSRTPLLQSPPAHHVEQVESAPTRFMKAFGVALLIYILVGSFTRTAIAGHYWRGRDTHRWNDVEEPDIDDGRGGAPGSQIPFPQPSDGKVEKCVTAAGATTLSSESVYMTSLLLPLTAKTLYIFGRGELAHGDITFTPSYDRTIPEDSIRVNIIPRYHSEIALMATNICLLERAKGEKGIAILTPSSWIPSNDLSFSIEIRIPVTRGPLRVNAFETHLPLFRHTFSAQLHGQVSFGSLYVRSTNQQIHAGYLEADNTTIQTTNSLISGVYRASHTLFLQTSNQPIKADITILNDDDTRNPTNITMITANSAIDAAITLLRSTSSRAVSKGGAFAVSAQTQNGALDLRFHTQPVDSRLDVTAQTSNAPAQVHLHPAYEGAFTIGTSHGPTDLTVYEKISDPSGRGRKRLWAVTERTAAAFNGRVWWSHRSGSDGDEGRGSVSVHTSNAAVQVTT
ncbi:hypothetical protein K466DRAFT_665654 [Polyporus arcularius HHB13444]|uniref:DUF7330 domain-containing protein n=1 Tax=Polyporus arcularius HHB13444 TaxID=1314778 RepID=A0A5C3P339_9APHY|nr:hypothetical protein K466DRAFT_665654 [Polyporus arcularius HHB13444]